MLSVRLHSGNVTISSSIEQIAIFYILRPSLLSPSDITCTKGSERLGKAIIHVSLRSLEIDELCFCRYLNYNGSEFRGN